VKYFRTPKRSLGYLDSEAAATLIAAAADIAVILDEKGTVRDLAFNSEELPDALAGLAGWIGSRWTETVTVESRPKVEALVAEAAARTVSAWRQVNHPAAAGPDVPVLYSVVQVRQGRAVAIGRDLRPIARLQQRLVEAQHSMERDYSRLRHVETRYRLLFELSTEALLLVDAVSRRIADANPAAEQLLGSGRRTVGRPFAELFDPAGAEAVQALLSGVRAAGRADDVQARLAGERGEARIAASLLRQEEQTVFLVRLVPVAADAAEAALPKLKSKLLKVVERAPDAVVVTDPEGRVLTANAAFLEMAQLGSEEQARGEPLERWLGRPGIDLDVLLQNLRRHGAVRLYGTTLRAAFGAPAEVEVSAVAVMNGGRPCCGFAIRDVSRRLAADARTPGTLPRSVEQLKELIGRVSLKELVRESTDMIERLYIEAALEMTGDNRASAAEMLGLSRQSLYVKLRRYGFAEASAGGEG